MQSSAPLDMIPPSFFCGRRRAIMPKLDDQISTLQERLKQLKLRQQRVDARKRAIETMRERKAETRRQFVVGSVILAKVQEGAMDPKQLRDWLDQTLTRRDDRALFHLPPKDEALKDVISATSVLTS
jgi:hypothetical protein